MTCWWGKDRISSAPLSKTFDIFLSAYFANPDRSDTCPTDTARGKPLAIFFQEEEILEELNQEALRSEPPSGAALQT